jgi:hypothetical protein
MTKILKDKFLFAWIVAAVLLDLCLYSFSLAKGSFSSAFQPCCALAVVLRV